VLDVSVRGQRVTPLAEALQEQGIPFLLVTGYGSDRLHERALQGATYLRKPVEARQLAQALIEVLAPGEHR
jgi:CheY-like chemotaxis protein